ncbi:MAG: O-acetyl-ADP-ribose deacetylase [Sciscionella sp.]|nr:O-acetyl-ADP-ribose deacetylase [Sciscionella sp.]
MPNTITLISGDITEQAVDAVVNAANSTLLGGGGVDGAIHAKGGPDILEQCRRLRNTSHVNGLPAGEAVATTAGRLPARWVVHTVGPVYSTREDRSAVLADAYRNTLRVAAELGARTVAFPAISAGAYGWPLDSAADIALRTVAAVLQHRDVEAAHDGTATESDRTFDREFDEVRFVLFNANAYRAFRAAAIDRGLNVG